MDDALTLVIGALIGIISSLVTYSVNHFLNIREKKVVRDFEVREKGRDFFHQTYGTVTSLSDMVAPFMDDETGDEAMILTEEGYIALPKEEIIRRYKTAYAKYSKLWCESREKGLEIFLTRNFVKIMHTFWAYAGYFNDDEECWNNKEAIKNFKAISLKYCDEVDKLMGLCEKSSKIPKWLNPKTWHILLRGEEID